MQIHEAHFYGIFSSRMILTGHVWGSITANLISKTRKSMSCTSCYHTHSN